jgi:azurin
MKSRHVLAASALALALSACGQSPAPTAEPPVAAPATEEAAAPAPVEAAPVAPAPVAATGSKPATVADCATTIEGNDAMQYNADSITIPASCTQFTINLKHAGAMAVNVMGHNVVVAREADMAGIAADGMSLTPEHVKPDDARIIAHTRMVGGGESASVTFDVAKVKDGGPFKFFCSFPGHLALMQGNLVVQ